MPIKSKPVDVPINSLKLDIDNPRFSELYSGSDDEDELIEYLLYNESGEDVAKNIVNADEFYPDRPLWVLKHGKKYLVKDGNRRCAAVKALKVPTKYGLNLPKKNFNELPVLVYKNEGDIATRILQEHTASLFREWDRIAKALEAYKLFKGGNSLDTMKEIDSQPSQLIKLASFYYRAVKIGGEDLKKLLRRGRGKTGGKTIIFERLFGLSKDCGYTFKSSPSYDLHVLSDAKFDTYISAMILFLKANPTTKTQDIDREGENFLKKLEPYGFSISSKDGSGESVESNITTAGTSTESSSNETSEGLTSVNNSTGRKRKSIKQRPVIERKKIPAALNKLIEECYNLDQKNFANAKMALTRVSFECTMKFVVENSLYKPSKNISDSNYFRNVFYDNQNNKRSFTDFAKLKTLFSQLIKNTGDRKAFESFDLDRPHQIIHNYKVAALSADSKIMCDNLLPLIEFMLKEEADLLSTLDLTKL